MINWITMFMYIVTKYTVVFQRLLACDALPICDVIGSDKSPILYLEFDWLLGHHGWASPKEWLIVQCWRSVSVYYYLAWLWSPHWSQWPVHPVASGIHGSIPRISLVIIWDFVVTGSFFFVGVVVVRPSRQRVRFSFIEWMCQQKHFYQSVWKTLIKVVCIGLLGRLSNHEVEARA